MFEREREITDRATDGAWWELEKYVSAHDGDEELLLRLNHEYHGRPWASWPEGFEADAQHIAVWSPFVIDAVLDALDFAGVVVEKIDIYFAHADKLLETPEMCEDIEIAVGSMIAALTLVRERLDQQNV